MRQLCKFIKRLLSQEEKIQKECIMNKEQIKEQLKTLEIEIKEQKKIARRHNAAWLKQAIAQHNAHVAKSEVRGLLIAYAYLRGKPFSSPEKNPFNENDSDQQSAMVKAKAVLGLTEVRVYPSITVHKPLPHAEFDAWLKNTVSTAQ
jgi:hypothetical protein